MAATAPVRNKDLLPSREVVSKDRTKSREMSDYLDAAMVRLDLEDKQIAAFDVWDCHPSFVQKVRTGEKPLPEDRIAQLPEYVQRAMLAEWASDLKLLVGKRAALAMIGEGLLILAQEELPGVPAMKMAKASI